MNPRWHIRRLPRLAFWLVAAVLAAVLLAVAACGDDDGASEDEIQEVEDIARQLFESGGGEIDFVLDHVTDNLLATVFFTTREECAANADDCIGEPATVESVSGTSIDGGTATTRVASDFGTFDMGLVREDGVWKADSLSAVSDEIPEGASTVDLTLIDFGFQFDAEDIPADGNFAFAITSEGEQQHEVALASIPPDVPLADAVEAIEEEPLALKLFIGPGDELNMALDEPLAPGRYALVCFFPDTDDPEGTPHAFKGMLSEFTIE